MMERTQTDRQTDRREQIGVERHKNFSRPITPKGNTYISKQTDRQAGRQAERQAGKE